MKAYVATSIRFTEEDIALIKKLEKLTGLGTTAILRLAIRESIDIWVKKSQR